MQLESIAHCGLTLGSETISTPLPILLLVESIFAGRNEEGCEVILLNSSCTMYFVAQNPEPNRNSYVEIGLELLGAGAIRAKA